MRRGNGRRRGDGGEEGVLWVGVGVQRRRVVRVAVPAVEERCGGVVMLGSCRVEEKRGRRYEGRREEGEKERIRKERN